MFIRTETNERAKAILSWLGAHKKQETQTTLAKQFGKSRTFVSLSLNAQSVTKASESLVNDIYEYLQKKYGF
ncbi:hypothetical protein FC84_GL001681 [Lapidilactobacillus dextrinicus DSM 20335]|uniref:XRE family transcriptional regulator n=1 Tax=Lapidilactobacillus dextrinicus DSM 20335 TaxID=1423738 RepID=A0A0R2BUQ4_9LACO|nr:hypothetical protein [Lapidilactobacillus dextrinicus]KRM79500.1 hypothetical protein FC84_GL001681 [Lapidilactobacillus dextrinicus DSM 20335]QFG46667.1 hypothetical protein LH506_04050 [Lapidilactobacillus dextrinicus]